VAAVRGTPALVQVFVVYYVFIFSYPRLEILGQPTAYWAGLVALTINTTGYQAEALRGGFQAVESGQLEAARALGMGPFHVFRRITLPQALRLVTLPLSNEWISNFKTSTVLSYITIVELYAWARTSIAYELGRPVEAFVILAIFYLVINVTLSRAVAYVERRRRIPGLGSLPSEGAGAGGRVPGVVAVRGSPPG
jgi:ABC-type amino acid transport system permease subunit